MDKAEIFQKIKEITNDITRLSGTLCAMECTDTVNYADNYAVLSMDAALMGEAIACKLRHLIYTGTNIHKADYLVSAADIQGIKIGEHEGVFEVTLPCLVPKRKARNQSEFLTDPLYFALNRYAENNKLPKYNQCVVCFSHIYDRRLSKRRIRDYDNLELKQLLDVIATFILKDDSGILCDAYNTTEFGETDCVQISVMDKNRFYQWIKEREKGLCSISDF